MTMSVTGLFYIAHRDVLQNDSAIDYLADSIKNALYTNTVTTPVLDTNTSYSSAPFNANEVTGTGYSAGGVALASPTIAVSSGTLVFDANDSSWTTATFTARGSLLYDDTISTPTSKPALAVVSFGADYSVTAGTFTVQWAAGGVINFTGM